MPTEWLLRFVESAERELGKRGVKAEAKPEEVMATVIDGDGDNDFTVSLQFMKPDGSKSRSLNVLFDSIEEMQQLADYLVGMAKELKGETDIPGRWVSVNDRLPEHGQRVICVNVDGEWFDCTYYGKRDGLRQTGFNYEAFQNIYHINLVTHWRPVVVPDQLERNAVVGVWTDNQQMINGDVIRETIKESGV